MAVDTSDKIKIMQAYNRGEAVQRLHIRSAEDPKRWCDDKNPEWDWRTYDYRIAPPKPVHHTIDWNHVSDGFDWLFTNGYGEHIISGAKPTKLGGFYVPKSGVIYVLADTHSSFKAGNMRWEISLVERPK